MLVAYHPVTLARDTIEETDALFVALESIPDQILFCYPNADAGSRALIERTKLFLASQGRGRIFTNLDAVMYWSLLRQAGMLVGNSSSGIMETASFALPTVNIGLRQQGRERAANVLDAEASKAAILQAIATARAVEFRQSLAGLVNPVLERATRPRKIVEVLTTVPLTRELLDQAPRADEQLGGNCRQGQRPMKIPLSAPDVQEEEIEMVAAVLRTRRS